LFLKVTDTKIRSHRSAAAMVCCGIVCC